MIRLLAGERAELAAQSAAGRSADPAAAGHLPSPAPHASLPAQRRAAAETPGGPELLPAPAAEPAWHAIGTMVRPRPGRPGRCPGHGGEPGQHVTVQTSRWPRVWRPYSVSRRPREDGVMTFHVKAVPGGWVSNALVYRSSPGDELILGPALGTMTLRPAGDRDLLCIAGGTGLSPIKAIIEQAIRESAACPRQIYLFYGARTRSELYDLPDLWRLADAYPGLQLTPVTSDDPAFDGMQGNVGRVATRYMPHREGEAYVAGPPAMVRETVRALARAGLPRERIHYHDTLLADGEQAS